MELSQYVSNAISAISSSGSRHNFAAARTLRERKLFDLLRAKAERQLNRTSKTSNSQGKMI
jgi:hypothetical protein